MLAVVVATIGVVLGASAIASWSTVGPVLAGTVMLAIVGAVDDIIVLPALPRLLCQGAAAVGIVYALRDQPPIFDALPASIEAVVVVLAVIWFVNLVNFMDGIDLITVVEIVPITIGIAVLTLLGEAPAIAGAVACTLLGGMLGFVPFNRPIARVFLGDVGSLPIGLLVAWLLLLLACGGHLAAAILLPLYYLADATITLGRRALRRERLWIAHRTHFYQRATDLGFTVAEIDARIFVTNAVLTGCAIASVRTQGALQVVPLGIGVLSVGVLLRILHRGRG